MDCYFSGFMGIALFFGSIATLSVNEEQHKILRNVFSDDLDKKYEDIINERRNHYIIGIIIGILISYFVSKNIRILNDFTRITLFLTITLGTAVLFYMLMPKSDYMLNHLKTSEENKKWLNVYNSMKSRYFIGFVLGILATIPLARTLC
jgi:uncharacterized protein YacL